MVIMAVTLDRRGICTIILDVSQLTGDLHGPYVDVNGRGYHFLSGSDSMVHVIKDLKRQGTLHLPAKLQDINILHNVTGNNSRIFCLTEDGTVWNVPFSQCEHNRRSEKADMDEDIFGELLAPDQPSGDPGATGHHNATEWSRDVDDSHRVYYPIRDAKKLCVSPSDIIVTLTRTSSAWQLAWVAGDSTPGGNTAPFQTLCLSHTNLSDTSQAFLGCFLPESKAGGCYINHTCHQLSNGFYNLLFGTEYNLVDCAIAVVGLPDELVCWVPLKSLPGADSKELHILYDLSQPLVTALPCCVVVTSDTVVITQPSMCTGLGDGTPQREGCNNALVLVGREGKVVLLSSPDRSRLPKAGSGGQHTKLKDACVVAKETDIPAPVMCCCLTGHYLVHSTGRDIYLTDLRDTFLPWCQSVSEASELKLSAQVTSIPLGISNVIMVSAESMIIEKDETRLGIVFVTRSGSVKQVLVRLGPLPSGQHRYSVNSAFTASPGQKLKDLLTGINDVSDRLDATKRYMEKQDMVLQNLALASVIKSGTLRGVFSSPGEGRIGAAFSKQKRPEKKSSARNQASPYEHIVEVNHEDLGTGPPRMTIVSKYRNLCGFTLSEGWFYCVTVTSPSRDVTNREEGNARENATPFDKDCFDDQVRFVKDMSIGDLENTQFVVLEFSLKQLMGTRQLSKILPLTVSTFLTYSPKMALGEVDRSPPVVEDTSADEEANSDCDMLHIPLPDVQIDVIDFLLPSAGSQLLSHESKARGGPKTLQQNIMDIARERRPCLVKQASTQHGTLWAPDTGNTVKESSALTSVPYCVHLPVSQTQWNIVKKSGKLEESTLLDYLLRSNKSLCGGPCGAAVCLYSPSSHQVALSVEDTDKGSVRLHIQSSNLAILCQSRQAFVSRYPLLFLRDQCDGDLEKPALRKYLFQFEGLLARAQELEEASATCESPSEELLQDICRLYEKLRQTAIDD